MKRLQTKTKILIPMFLLTSILIFISTVVIYNNYSKIASLKILKEKILFSSQISVLLHTLQKERGFSCAFKVNEGTIYKHSLCEQRKITDREIRKLEEELGTISSVHFQKKIQKLIKQLSNISKTRDAINNYSIKYDKIISYYSNVNKTLLDILIIISKDSHVPLISENILAYINLQYFKEYMGIERAEGVTIFSKKELPRKSLIRFSNILSLEKRSEDIFLKYASPEMAKEYYRVTQEKRFQHISNMEHEILYTDITDSSTEPKMWFTLITQKLNSLEKASNFIKEKTVQNIQKEISKLKNIFISMTILILLSLLTFILMIVAFFRLAREEQRLRIVMDKYIISSTTDLKGIIIDVSEAFCAISGYKREELIGHPHKIVRHPDTPKAIFKDMWFRLQQGLSWSGKIKNKRKDGSFYWVYANTEPLFNSHGKIDSYISIRINITESELLILKIKEEERKSKFQEEMLREQSRLAQMGEIISMIAHQWRQPLTAITAAAGSLEIKAKRETLNKETTLLLTNKIKDFSSHLSATINDFRNFFKTNKQKTQTSFEKILNDVLSIIDISLSQNNIELSIELQEVQDFDSFENELKQVILNLIKNAEDALLENNVEKPTIALKVTQTTFSIEDNAGGIPEDVISKIFDPYFSTKQKKDGTGLGLYMSKIIVEDHCNGAMTVSNEENGAKFQIYIGNNNG